MIHINKFFLLITQQAISHAIKISFIVGSHYAFFSSINCILPVAGFISGYAGFGISMLIHLFYSILFSKTILFTTFFGFLTIIRLPTLIAGLYATNQSRIMQYIISLLCIVLFLIHPEGNQAPLYTLYWFIPLLWSMLPIQHNIYIRFLNTTLLQHAIGSVIFLYRTNMHAIYWNSLIPIVAVERFLFASGMFVTYYIITYICATIENIQFPILTKNSKNNKITL